MSLELRPYQKQDIEKLSKFKTCAILNKPRTGKTPTSLILSSKWPTGKTLIVCTGSMLYKWQKEYQDWLQEPCEVYTGTPKQRQQALDNWTHGLVVTYDTLKIIKHYKKQPEETLTSSKKVVDHKTGALEIIRSYKPTKLIVDEFHRAKGHNTARAHALNLLAKDIEYRVALTGTPAYSTQLDVYNMLHFLWPQYPDFSTWWKFSQKYVKFNAIWTKHNGIASQKEIPIALNEQGIKLVHTLFNKYCTQRNTSDADVMPWLPKDPIPELILLPCNAFQKKAIADLEKWFETEDEEIIAKNGLDKITKIRQLLSDPKILIPEVKTHSPKTQYILDYLREYSETPTIYFTNSTKHIKILMPLMNKITKTECIIGATPSKERTRLEKEFQEGKIKHLICNTQAVQEGLTLDSAEVEIFIEQFPPYGSVYQASQRFTPTNPDKAKLPKKILKLIMKNTYDESINETLNSRKENINILNNFKNYIAKK